MNSFLLKDIVFTNSCISSSTLIYFFLPIVKLATISVRAAAVAALKAAILPPPGTGSLEAVFSKKLFILLLSDLNNPVCFLVFPLCPTFLSIINQYSILYNLFHRAYANMVEDIFVGWKF